MPSFLAPVWEAYLDALPAALRQSDWWHFSICPYLLAVATYFCWGLILLPVDFWAPLRARARPLPCVADELDSGCE